MAKNSVATKGRRRPRKGPGRPLNSDENVGRDMLLEAAKQVLRTTEPALVTRQMVAERAGVDPNLVRYYFGNMSNLIAEVIADNHRRTRHDMSAMRSVEKPLERLRFRIDRTLSLFADNPFHHKIVAATLYGDATSEGRREWEAIVKESLVDLEEILEIGARQGVLRKVDPRFLHLLIIAACEFVATNEPVLRLLFGKSASAKRLEADYLDFLFDLIMRGLTPMPASPRKR